jgi:hypothetical protein
MQSRIVPRKSDFSLELIASVFRVKEKPSKRAAELGGKLVKVIATNIPADRRAGRQEGNTGKCNSSGETFGGVDGN